jgi:hypothetical protein
MRYELELEMLEQTGVIGDEQAIALVRSEFALAQNAGRFDAIASGDIEIGAVSRSTPQEGVTRYVVELFVDEREPDIGAERARALLCRAFTNAINASHFLRICEDALTMKLVSREQTGVYAQLRSAA